MNLTQTVALTLACLGFYQRQGHWGWLVLPLLLIAWMLEEKN